MNLKKNWIFYKRSNAVSLVDNGCITFGINNYRLDR